MPAAAEGRRANPPAALRYAYYAKLRPRQKAIYRQSDAIGEVPLPGAARLQPLVREVQTALAAAQRPAVERAAKVLANAILANLKTAPIRMRVLAARPSKGWGELHGLYEPIEGRALATITLWMRTAHHKKVVAYRTFLRTLLHELGHHLDYELLGLEDSFHTEGFFKRESSLFKQLVEPRVRRAG
jgi:hypothetical protein